MKLDRYYIAGMNRVCLDLKNLKSWESEIDFETSEVNVKYFYSPKEFAIVNYQDGKQAEFDFIRIKNNIERIKNAH
jgi:uncharacterized protein YkuJ